MPIFDKNLPRNADRPIENSADVAFTAGAASVALTTSSPNTLYLNISEDSALTLTGMVKDQVLELITDPTGGPWDITVNGADLSTFQTATAGNPDFITGRYLGAAWFWHVGGAADATA